MNPLSQTIIERTILSVLADVAPRLLPVSTLCSQTNLAAGSGVARAEFDAALSSLLAKEPAQVFCAKTDDGNKYKITAAGEARLCE